MKMSVYLGDHSSKDYFVKKSECEKHPSEKAKRSELEKSRMSLKIRYYAHSLNVVVSQSKELINWHFYTRKLLHDESLQCHLN